MKKRRFKKRIWIPIVVLLLAIYPLYITVFVSDIPITQPNVNFKPVGNLELKQDTLINHWGDFLPVESGRFVVKEDRESAASNHIEIYFRRFKTSASQPMSPIIFLAGGPGTSATEIGKTQYFYLFKELSKYADVILLDQRGVGQSIPNLHCRNFLETPTDIVKDVQEEILKDLVNKGKECAASFTDMGIQLQAYNSYSSALDIEDLRVALNYEKVSLYGYSYGTELAQFYIREFEKRVDKAILAGSLAPDHGLKLPFEVEQQFKKMDSLIKLDKKLSKYIPDFIELVKSTHKDIQSTPKYIQVPMQDAFDDDFPEKSIGAFVAFFRPTWNMTLTDDHLQMIVAENIGKDSWISRFPSFYYKIAHDSLQEVGNGLRNFRGRRLPNALFFTANAHSGYTDERWATSVAQGESSYLSHFGISYGRYPEVYQSFGIEKVTGMNSPVFSKVKTLLISGTLDGRTPMNLSDVIAERFPNNYRIVVENTGHNGLLNNEILEGVKGFLQDSLKTNVTIHKPIEFKNPVPFQYAIKDTIVNQVKEKGARAGIALYKELYQKYNSVDDYIFDFTPNPFYAVASDFIEEQNYKEIIELLSYLIAIYPEDALLYDYLSVAYFESGDTDKAAFCSQKALEINQFDGNAHIMLSRITSLKEAQ